jgi:hypothetical protein
MMVATVTKLRTGQSVLNGTLNGTLKRSQLNQLSLAGQPFANWLGMNMTVTM